MTKKIICCILTLVFLSSSLAFASADTNFVASVGGYSFDENKTVTRGEFVYAAAGLFAKGFSLEKAKTPFADVSSSNKFSGAIALASELGWVSGYGDGTFGVNDQITYEQAIIVTLRALGYEKLIESFGGYMSAANYIGLTKNLSVASAYITGIDAATILRNALEGNALVQTGFGNDMSWESNENLTNLKQFLNIEVIDGIVTDNGISSLTSASSVKRGYIKIDSMLIKAENSAIIDCLGYRVHAYVKTDEKTPELVYFENDETSVIKIPATSIESVENFSITHKNAYGREITSRISDVADFIYNGVACPDAVKDDMKISEGALVLIDNNLDSKADIVRIEEARNAVAMDVNSDKTYVTTHYGSDISIKDDAFVTVIKDNKIIDISEIKEWNVLTVYQSKDSSVITIYISDKIFRGLVSEKSSDKETIAVDGEFYILQNKDLYDELEPGSEYEFCTDIYGNIVYKLDSFEYSVAVLLGVQPETTGLNKSVKIKLFTKDGSIKIYDFTDKVNFCGKSKSKEDLPALMSLPQYSLVGYNLNSENKVSKIVLTSESVPYGYMPKENFKKTYEDSEIIYQGQQKSFAGKIMLNNSTTVFVFPSDSAKESEYFISDVSLFTSGNKYNVVSFVAGENDWYADYIICIPSFEYGKTHGAIVVDSISTAIGENGENIEVLKGYTEKGLVEYKGAEDFHFSTSGISRGDIIRCILNPSGDVCDVRWIFAQSSFAFKNDSGNSYAAQPRFLHGYVYEKNGNLVKISLHPNVPPAVTDSNMEIHDFSGMKLYEYDKSRDVITVISVDMLTDYMTNNVGYSKLFLYTTSSTPKFAVSYK